jgi:HSP20 family protein
MKRNTTLSGWPTIWFDDFMSASSGSAAKLNPSCDVEETEAQYVFSFDLPGVSRDDVKIELHDGQLTVSGERKFARPLEAESTRHFTERYYGGFQRSFSLPAKVDANQVEAAYEDGVLTIIVPKSEAAKPKTIRIGESKGGLFGKLLGEKNKDTAA